MFADNNSSASRHPSIGMNVSPTMSKDPPLAVRTCAVNLHYTAMASYFLPDIFSHQYMWLGVNDGDSHPRHESITRGLSIRQTPALMASGSSSFLIPCSGLLGVCLSLALQSRYTCPGCNSYTGLAICSVVIFPSL